MAQALGKEAKRDNLGGDNVTMVSYNDREVSHFADYGDGGDGDEEWGWW